MRCLWNIFFPSSSQMPLYLSRHLNMPGRSHITPDFKPGHDSGFLNTSCHAHRLGNLHRNEVENIPELTEFLEWCKRSISDCVVSIDMFNMSDFNMYGLLFSVLRNTFLFAEKQAERASLVLSFELMFIQNSVQVTKITMASSLWRALL